MFIRLATDRSTQFSTSSISVSLSQSYLMLLYVTFTLQTTKSMVEFAPAEISALELYESSLAKQSERKSVRQRQLEVDRVELKRKIRCRRDLPNPSRNLSKSYSSSCPLHPKLSHNYAIQWKSKTYFPNNYDDFNKLYPGSVHETWKQLSGVRIHEH